MVEMQPSAPPRPLLKSRPMFIVAIVAVVIAAIAIIAVLVQIWYGTTLQPRITLTAANYVTGACVPMGNGYYANRFNWTFTLVNTGTADGDASVGFLLDGNSVGYTHYLVPQHSQVTENATVYGSGYPSPAQCGGPETPGISLASVAGGYVIDIRTVIQTLVQPVATMAFTGALLGFLQYQAHRRGFSIFADLGASGWGIALLTVFAAGFFAGVLAQFLVTPYNIPLDWTPAILSGIALSALGVAVFAVGYREMLRAGRPKQPIVK